MLVNNYLTALDLRQSKTSATTQTSKDADNRVRNEQISSVKNQENSENVKEDVAVSFYINRNLQKTSKEIEHVGTTKLTYNGIHWVTSNGKVVNDLASEYGHTISNPQQGDIIECSEGLNSMIYVKSNKIEVKEETANMFEDFNNKILQFADEAIKAQANQTGYETLALLQ